MGALGPLMGPELLRPIVTAERTAESGVGCGPLAGNELLIEMFAARFFRAANSTLSRSLASERGVKRIPLARYPAADRNDSCDDRNQHDPDQHGVFEQRRAFFVGGKTLGQIQNLHHKKYSPLASFPVAKFFQ